MPRRKNADASTRIEIYLPESLVEKLRQKFWDPVRQKPKYGKVGNYIESLIRKDLEEKEA